ncbi:MAG: hypothetical protein Q7W05_14885 [Deltaproteobacteria bacterium]|nr:hypothetical protein [Deltaproteobacteria bacterium]
MRFEFSGLDIKAAKKLLKAKLPIEGRCEQMPLIKYIWDLFVRLFHWPMTLLFFVAHVTGNDKGAQHRYVGYAVLGLVVIRISGGFVGTEHA